MANGDKIRISVKGTADETAREIVRRGLLASLIEERNGRSFWDVFPEDEHGGPAIAAVTAWYCEPAVCAEGVGFPPGTLLFYS